MALIDKATTCRLENCYRGCIIFGALKIRLLAMAFSVKERTTEMILQETRSVYEELHTWPFPLTERSYTHEIGKNSFSPRLSPALYASCLPATLSNFIPSLHFIDARSNFHSHIWVSRSQILLPSVTLLSQMPHGWNMQFPQVVWHVL